MPGKQIPFFHVFNMFSALSIYPSSHLQCDHMSATEYIFLILLKSLFCLALKSFHKVKTAKTFVSFFHTNMSADN